MAKFVVTFLRCPSREQSHHFALWGVKTFLSNSMPDDGNDLAPLNDDECVTKK